MTASAKLLELDNVTKRFGGLIAVNGISMTVNEGEVIGIIGPNGSGKTTLFATISGFFVPTEGTISFKGTSIAGLKPHQICEMGLVRTFQVAQPFKGMTVLENVLVGALRGGRDLDEARQIGSDVVDFVGLGSHRHKKAADLTLVDLKRLEFARALATEPELLLLDEVMAGLRPTEVDSAVELVRKVRARGITILFVEHLMRAVLALSDRLLAMHHGFLIGEGRPDDVIRQSEVIDAYFGHSPSS